MIVYILATCLSAMFAYLSILTKKKLEITYTNSKNMIYGNIIYKITVVIAFLPLFLVSALRYNVGTDYFYRYVPGFKFIQYGGKETYEKGFLLLNKIILLFTTNYQWLFIITSFIFCFFVYKAIYDQSKDIVYSIFLLLITDSYFISLNTLRQCIGVSIFLYATKYIKTRDIKRYIIWILIASTFHISALIYLPVYFLYKINIKVQIIIFAIFILAKSVISKFFIEFVLFTKYGAYFQTAFNVKKFDFWEFFINLCILIFCYAFYKKGKNDVEYKIFVNIQFLNVALLLFSSVIPLISRVTVCFTFSQIIFLPKVLSYINNRILRNTIKIAIILLYIIYMVNTIVIRGYHEVLPYQTIFSI